MSGGLSCTLPALRYVATRKIQRYTANTLDWPHRSNSRLETTHRGGRCDWVQPDSVYVHLGLVREKGSTGVALEADLREPPDPVIPTIEEQLAYLDWLDRGD